MGSTWSYLDITALELKEWEDSPNYRRPAVQVVEAPRRLQVGGRRVGAEIRRGALALRAKLGSRPSGGAVIAHVGGVPVEETCCRW